MADSVRLFADGVESYIDYSSIILLLSLVLDIIAAALTLSIDRVNSCLGT